MNIIIEGPDATGKTTLVEKILAKHPNMTLLHDTGKTKNDKEYYMSLLEKDNYRISVGTELLFVETATSDMEVGFSVPIYLKYWF